MVINFNINRSKFMGDIIIFKGTRNFRLFYKIYFFDGKKTCCNHVIISEVFNLFDAISTYDKYIKFILQDEEIEPEIEFFDFKEIFEIYEENNIL